MRRVSPNARRAADAQSTDYVEVILMMIEHPDLDVPVRLSTDNTERLSLDPLMYGTRSTWRGSDPATEPFLYIVAGAELPGDEKGIPETATIMIENVSSRIGKVLRSFTTPARFHIAVVGSETPDVVEVEYTGLFIVDASGTASEVRIEVSERLILDETFPKHRFTRNRFPALIQ